jgi:hypothetical protein
MIQRIQTLWLLLAAIAVFASLKVSFYFGNIISTGENGASIKTWTELNGMFNMITNILTVTIGVLSLITIFLFSNRKLQLKFIVVGIILELLLITVYQFSIKQFSEGGYSAGSFIQLLVVLFFILALRGIRKDNKIIAESNRLR